MILDERGRVLPSEGTTETGERRLTIPEWNEEKANEIQVIDPDGLTGPIRCFSSACLPKRSSCKVRAK